MSEGPNSLDPDINPVHIHFCLSVAKLAKVWLGGGRESTLLFKLQRKPFKTSKDISEKG